MPKKFLFLIISILIIPIIISATTSNLLWESTEQIATSTDPLLIPAINFSIKSDGKVGIGTTAPAQKIELNGGENNTRLRIASTAIKDVGFEFYNSTDFVGGLLLDSAGDVLSLYSPAGTGGAINLFGAGKINFANGSNGTIWMTIKNDGMVGIGSTNPTSPLYVVGNVSADSFTDRTPYFEGLALPEILKIKGSAGEIDHTSLPEFAKVEKKITEEIVIPECEIFLKNQRNSSSTEEFKKKWPENCVSGTKESTITERNLGAMISLLTKAIQEQQTQIEDLRKQIGTLLK